MNGHDAPGAKLLPGLGALRHDQHAAAVAFALVNPIAAKDRVVEIREAIRCHGAIVAERIRLHNDAVYDHQIEQVIPHALHIENEAEHRQAHIYGHHDELYHHGPCDEAAGEIQQAGEKFKKPNSYKIYY